MHMCAMSPLMGIEFHEELVARGSDQASRVLFIVGTSLLPEHHTYLKKSGCTTLLRPLRKELLLRTLEKLVDDGDAAPAAP